MANVYGVPVQRMSVLEEATSMGAALAGGVAVGMYPGFEMIHRMNQIEETFHPDPAVSGEYDALLAVFDETYHALAGVFKKLGK